MAVTAAALAGCPAPGAIVRPDQPPSLTAPDEELPSLKTDQLDNGLRVVWLPGRGERFSAALVVDAHARFDPAGLEGLGALVAQTAVLGTEGDPDRLTRPNRRALRVGGTLRVVNDGAVAGWVIEGPRANASALMELLADVSRRPTFPATRVQAAAELAREHLSLVPGFGARLGRALAVGTALRQARLLPSEPTEATLGTANREDLVRHHRRVIRPDRAVLVVTERRDQRRLTPFATWRRPDAPPPAQLACAGGSLDQRFISGRRDESYVMAAVPVPGPGHALRPALDALIALRRRLELGPDHTSGLELAVEDRGRDAVLLLVGRGSPDEATAQHYLALAELRERIDDPLLVPMARRAYRAAATRHDLTPWRRLARAARAALFGLDAGEAAITRATLGEVAALIANEDRWSRVASGSDAVRQQLQRWGPVSPWRADEQGCQALGDDGG